jgi:hypothetical protein
VVQATGGNDDLDELVVAYARLADDRDGAGLANLFMDDGRIETYDDLEGDTAPRASLVGRDVIGTAINGLARYRTTFHLLGQREFHRVDHDRAEGTTYCEAHHIFDHEGEAWDRIMYIRYSDVIGRGTDGVRRFISRTLHVRVQDFRPLGAALPLPPVPGEPA